MVTTGDIALFVVATIGVIVGLIWSKFIEMTYQYVMKDDGRASLMNGLMYTVMLTSICILIIVVFIDLKPDDQPTSSILNTFRQSDKVNVDKGQSSTSKVNQRSNQRSNNWL